MDQGIKGLDPDLIGLWRYNLTTGYWDLARQCAAYNASMWLAAFSRDKPDIKFVLSKRKPRLPKD